MSEKKYQTLEIDPLRREAVTWVQKLVSGQATPQDAEVLKRWCARSSAHASAFAEASQVWNEAGQAGLYLAPGADDRAAILARLGRRSVATRRAFLGGLATTAAAAYAVVHPPLGLWPSFSELAADYRTVTGEQRHIMLADHVSVRLNTQTSISRQPSKGDAEHLELISGEASFTMPQGVRQSIVVTAANGRTVGSGARFDVRYLDGKAVCVTCFEGSVQIEYSATTTQLAAGRQLRYGENGLGQASAIDPEAEAAWHDGVVVFQATRLSEVVEEINRYRPGRIILANAALAQQPVSGRFRIDQMDTILARLQQAFNAEAQTLPGGIVLLS